VETGEQQIFPEEIDRFGIGPGIDDDRTSGGGPGHRRADGQERTVTVPILFGGKAVEDVIASGLIDIIRPPRDGFGEGLIQGQSTGQRQKKKRHPLPEPSTSAICTHGSLSSGRQIHYAAKINSALPGTNLHSHHISLTLTFTNTMIFHDMQTKKYFFFDFFAMPPWRTSSTEIGDRLTLRQ
jgi:hypothetical protein